MLPWVIAMEYMMSGEVLLWIIAREYMMLCCHCYGVYYVKVLLWVIAMVYDDY